MAKSLCLRASIFISLASWTTLPKSMGHLPIRRELFVALSVSADTACPTKLHGQVPLKCEPILHCNHFGIHCMNSHTTLPKCHRPGQLMGYIANEHGTLPSHTAINAINKRSQGFRQDLGTFGTSWDMPITWEETRRDNRNAMLTASSTRTGVAWILGLYIYIYISCYI